MGLKGPNSAMHHVAKLKLYSKPRITTRVPSCGFDVMMFNGALDRGAARMICPVSGIALCAALTTLHPFLVREGDDLFIV
jgi:hypothetical protein